MVWEKKDSIKFFTVDREKVRELNFISMSRGKLTFVPSIDGLQIRPFATVSSRTCTSLISYLVAV